MKAKISNNYRPGISYRFLQARAFHCPRKEAEWNQGRERGGGERGKKNKEGEKENEVAPVETRKSVGKKRGRKGGKGWSVVVRNRKRR